MIGKRSIGLGRGLGALIPPKQGGTASFPHESTDETSAVQSRPVFVNEDESVYREIPVTDIAANPSQPRQHFDHAALEDLVTSIQERGIIEPLVVTEVAKGKYEIIAGERRLRAAKISGLEKVPCVIRDATDQDKLEIAIIENVQRHDLNPIEEAIAYKRLMDEFGMTQDDVGKRVGKSRPQVANTVRLLQLPHEVQQALVDRKISASNARTLLSLPGDDERIQLFNAMLSQNFTVREVERRVPHPRRTRADADPNVLEQERKLRETLGHRVDIKRNQEGGGEIRIRFETDEDFMSLSAKLRGLEE